MTDRLIGGVPESLITEDDSGNKCFLSIYRIRALPDADQWRLRQTLAEHDGWWPITQGWIYQPDREAK